MKKRLKISNRIERNVSLIEGRKPILFVNSFWSRIYAFDLKRNYTMLYKVDLEGWQKFPSTVLKSSGFLVYSANKSAMLTQQKYLYVWNTGNKRYMDRILIKQDTMVLNLEHYG